MSGISRDVWLKALEDAGIAAQSDDDQNAVTIKEFADLMGYSYQTAQRFLHKLTVAGKAKEVTKRQACPDGRRVWSYKAWRLIDPSE